VNVATVIDYNIADAGIGETTNKKPRLRRGGFAVEPESGLAQGNQLEQNTTMAVTNTSTIVPPLPANQPLKKCKRDEDHEDREDRHSKRILQSQENYGLLGHQDIALKAAECLTVVALSNKYQLLKFLDYYKASPYHVANPMTDSTLVEIWQSIRVQEPQCRFHPKSIWRHAHAQPPHQKKTAIADPVLYTRDASMLNVAHAQIHGTPDLKLQLARHETDPLKKIVMSLGFG
jgi:hypothetical protein